MKEKYLEINKPCAENWENMKPDENGNFCEVCTKSVRDFTQLSQFEIAQELKNSKGNICARVTKHQLNTPLLDIEISENINFPLSKVAASIILATSLTAGTQAVQANTHKVQTEVTIHTTPVSINKNVSQKKTNFLNEISFITIKGVVKTKIENNPVENAELTFVTFDKQYVTHTLADGSFSLEIPKDKIKAKNILRVSYNTIVDEDPINFKMYEIDDIILNREKLNTELLILAKEEVIYLGGIGGIYKSNNEPIVLENGNRIKYSDFMRALGGKKSSCSLENKEYKYFEPKIAQIIYGKEAKYGLYILNAKNPG